MASRPASMRLAMAISPSRDKSSTEPISRRYIRTGSSVRSAGSLASDLAGGFLRDLDQLAGLGLLLFRLLARLFLALGFRFLGLDHVDAHLAHHRQHVLDLLGGDFLRRHHGIELLIGDIAALLGLLDHLLDGGVRQIEQRQRRVRGLGRLFLRRLTFLLRGGLLGRPWPCSRSSWCPRSCLPCVPSPRTPVPTNAASISSSPTLWLLPTPGGRTAFRGRVLAPHRRPANGQKGAAAPAAPPESSPYLSRNSVKLRLTLFNRDALLFPRCRGVQRRSRRSGRSRGAAGLVAEPLDQGLGSVERGEPGLHVAQPRIIRLGVVLAERQFRVLKFPS